MAKGLYIYIFCSVAVTGREMRDNCLLDHVLYVLHHLPLVLAEQVGQVRCVIGGHGKRLVYIYIFLQSGCDRQRNEGQLSFRSRPSPPSYSTGGTGGCDRQRYCNVWVAVEATNNIAEY